MIKDYLCCLLLLRYNKSCLPSVSSPPFTPYEVVTNKIRVCVFCLYHLFGMKQTRYRQKGQIVCLLDLVLFMHHRSSKTISMHPASTTKNTRRKCSDVFRSFECQSLTSFFLRNKYKIMSVLCESVVPWI